MKNKLSVRTYFSRSPFRSPSFIAVTVVTAILAYFEFRSIHTNESLTTCLSNAMLLLMLLPFATWVSSLFLHWEIRGLVEARGSPVAYSRLARLHKGLVLGISIFVFLIVVTLIAPCVRKEAQSNQKNAISHVR